MEDPAPGSGARSMHGRTIPEEDNDEPTQVVTGHNSRRHRGVSRAERVRAGPDTLCLAIAPIADDRAGRCRFGHRPRRQGVRRPALARAAATGRGREPARRQWHCRQQPGGQGGAGRLYRLVQQRLRDRDQRSAA
ncbi:protein of unknown function [Cupriavidus taiwanensis]|nr:protein of unknown function [Cupriavidus taiwanensis]